MGKKLKIMHGMVEVSGQNSYAVRGLRAIGEDAETVLLSEHLFSYPYDRIIGIDKSKKYLLPWNVLKLSGFLIEALFRYNVFHFHFGNSICNNKDLWLYRLFGKKVFYEFHGSDLRIYEEYCRKSRRPFTPELATRPNMLERNKIICAKADQIILHDDELIPYLPENHAPVQVVPLRVDPELFTPVYPEKTNNKTIRLVHAPTDREVKGSKYIIAAFERLKEKYDNIELVLVEGKTQNEARKIYETADIVIDQLFIGTYGVFSIECMALGKPVITYISEEMRQALPEELPIVSADIDTIEKVLDELISNAEKRNEIGVLSRKYVETYHDYRNIAYVLRDIYSGKLSPATGREAFERVKNVKAGIE